MKLSKKSIGQGRFELSSIQTAVYSYPRRLKEMMVAKESKRFREITAIENIFKMDSDRMHLIFKKMGVKR